MRYHIYVINKCSNCKSIKHYKTDQSIFSCGEYYNLILSFHKKYYRLSIYFIKVCDKIIYIYIMNIISK